MARVHQPESNRRETASDVIGSMIRFGGKRLTDPTLQPVQRPSSADRLATEAVENDPNFSIASGNGSQSTATHPGANVIYLPKATSDDTAAGETDGKATTEEGLVVARFPKNRREEVRAVLKTYMGYTVADVRVWVRNDDSRVAPTQKGLCIRVEQLPDLLVAVAALVKAHDDRRVQSALAGERDDAAGGEE